MLAGAALAATATAAPQAGERPRPGHPERSRTRSAGQVRSPARTRSTASVRVAERSRGRRAPVTGTAVDSAGTTLGTATQAVTVRSRRAGACDILRLKLGPLDLNLLGLGVHLDQVVLDITAEQGPGNLLGNLLCAVAGLLDRPTGGGGGGLSGLLQGIIGLLNQILGQLLTPSVSSVLEDSRRAPSSPGSAAPIRRSWCPTG